MRHITHAMAATVINTLPSRFDTHLVEKRLFRLHTVDFANELLEFQSTSDPLHQFSAALGKWIDSEFREQIRQTQKVLTENMGGEQSQNQEWEKLSTQIT